MLRNTLCRLIIQTLGTYYYPYNQINAQNSGTPTVKLKNFLVCANTQHIVLLGNKRDKTHSKFFFPRLCLAAKHIINIIS